MLQRFLTGVPGKVSHKFLHWHMQNVKKQLGIKLRWPESEHQVCWHAWGSYGSGQQLGLQACQ